MKRELTIITRGAIYLMGLAVIAVCAIMLPEIAREEALSNPNSDRITYPFLVGAWIFSIPIFIALHQTLKLLSYIDQNNAFSNRSIKALQNIKICAIIFSTLIFIGAVTTITMARIADPREDVTHIITLGAIITFVSIIIATFTGVLQRLLQEAIELKSENDLTV